MAKFASAIRLRGQRQRDRTLCAPGGFGMTGALAKSRLTIVVSAFLAGGAAAVWAANSRPVEPAEPIASVDRAQGEARLERNGILQPVQVGQAIARRDRIETVRGGRVLVRFNDGSRLSLGENALLVIADFVAEEGRKSGALILDLVRGAMRLNAVAPMQAPDKRVEVRTPVAIISSRGVDMWSGPVDGQFGVLVINGKLDVRNDAGWVSLDRKRFGTTISQRIVAPQKPTVWSVENTSRMLQTVAFK
jgi:hypothetical protein